MEAADKDKRGELTKKEIPMQQYFFSENPLQFAPRRIIDYRFTRTLI